MTKHANVGMPTKTPAQQAKPQVPEQHKLNGVVIGLLLGFNAEGLPMVAFPGNPSETALIARSTTTLSNENVGKEVALLFEAGDSERPIVIGPIQSPAHVKPEAKSATNFAESSAEIDGERITLSAKREIVLSCGESSITLTRAGKVLIRGKYISSHSTGANRIKGGSVQIN